MRHPLALGTLALAARACAPQEDAPWRANINKEKKIKGKGSFACFKQGQLAGMETIVRACLIIELCLMHAPEDASLAHHTRYSDRNGSSPVR